MVSVGSEALPCGSIEDLRAFQALTSVAMATNSRISRLEMEGRASAPGMAQTLFALVLRGLYDEGVRAGGLTEDGEVLCDYIELQEKFHLMTGRNLPLEIFISACTKPSVVSSNFPCLCGTCVAGCRLMP